MPTIDSDLKVASHEIDLEDGDYRQKFLAGVAELAKEAGDWRPHLPSEAASLYLKQRAIRVRYQHHVKNCAYCRALIAIFPVRSD